jgi:hypothetical protein
MIPRAHSVGTLPVSAAVPEADPLPTTAESAASAAEIDLDLDLAEAPWSLPGPMPDAHLMLTERFTPFLGHEAYRHQHSSGTLSPRLRPSTVFSNWYLQGRRGELTGLIFGDFELGAIFGAGDLVLIYRARQRSRERRVVVKTIAGTYANDPVQRRRFELEVRAASLIQSAHVVEVFASGTYNGIAYLVMELVEGTNLAEVIAEYREEDCRLPPEVVAEWILHAARGLAAAAREGIVHRDIKPANLLINLDQVVKITDFGISKCVGEDDLPGLGTASYLSPEQGRGVRCDQRADIYSLGVVFYELLTNQKPFVGTTRDSLIYQHNFTEPRLPRELEPGIPEPYQAIMVTCLQKDPARRYQSAVELVADLERLKAGDLAISTVCTRPYTTGADEAVRRCPGQTGRWFVTCLVTLVILIVALLVGACWWQLEGLGQHTAGR